MSFARAVIVAVLLLSLGGVQAATKKAISTMEAQILALYRDDSPIAVIEVLGAPTTRTEGEGIEFLTWKTSKFKRGFMYYYGLGVTRSYSCTATFQYKKGRLSKVSLVWLKGGDRTLCRKLGKQLLRSKGAE